MRSATLSAFVTALALATALPAGASAQTVDPTTTFYAMDYLDGASLHGSFTALSIIPPYAVLRTLPRSRINGALTLDPTRGLIYGGSCCVANSLIEAYDATRMEPLPARDITLATTGSVAMKVDAVRRALFVYDTVARTLRAVSLEEAAYGTLGATVTLTALPAEPAPTSVGDMMAIDTRAGRIFITGGDGGPLLAVDITAIRGNTGDFGAIVATGSTARRSGNSAGAVAIDVPGRRVFFIPANGVVRVISADAPYATIRDLAIPGQGGNDCGLFYDGRSDTLYVGRGTGPTPVAVVVATGVVTPFGTGGGSTYGLSFTGLTGACPATGVCAACTAPGGCPAAAPACDAASGACRACTGSADCAAPTPVCLPSGACGACSATDARLCPATAPACSAANTCVLCTPGSSGSAAACASSADGHACEDGAAGAFCGCGVDADCGGAASGRVCDATARRCVDGCSPAPSRNACPAGQFCTSDDATGARAGRCTATCNFDADCVRSMPAMPFCLAGGDGGASRCAACRGDADCGDGRVCDPTTLSCAARPDAGVPDTGVVVDVGVADVGVEDVGVEDVGVADAGIVDVGVADVGVADAGLTDVAIADAAADAPAEAATVDAAADVTQDAAIDNGASDVALDAVDEGDAASPMQDVALATDSGPNTPPTGAQDGGCGCAVPTGAPSNGAAAAMALAALAVASRRTRRARRRA